MRSPWMNLELARGCRPFASRATENDSPLVRSLKLGSNKNGYGVGGLYGAVGWRSNPRRPRLDGFQ